jgi:hypothetical protein
MGPAVSVLFSAGTANRVIFIIPFLLKTESAYGRQSFKIAWRTGAIFALDCGFMTIACFFILFSFAFPLLRPLGGKTKKNPP